MDGYIHVHPGIYRNSTTSNLIHFYLHIWMRKTKAEKEVLLEELIMGARNQRMRVADTVFQERMRWSKHSNIEMLIKKKLKALLK